MTPRKTISHARPEPCGPNVRATASEPTATAAPNRLLLRTLACAAAAPWLALSPAALPLTLLAITATPAHAQNSAGGAVAGRVQEAATGQYLNNARISVVGTNRETFTNQFGEFRLADLPAGTTTLRVFYTGLEAQTLDVTVPAGETVQQDVRLTTTGVIRRGDILELDQFVVATQRETNAQAIAINEQRFAANIKNVVSTDAFGEINQGNIGEFLKHVPGVTIEYNGQAASGIQVRGFTSNYTEVTLDGGAMASAASPANTQNHSRSFGLEQASINNLSRIEVVKLPTPDMPANLLGGAVNLVSKSAFERDRAELTFSAYLTANSDETSLEQTPGPGNGMSHKVRPSFDLTYALPVNKRFGVVLTASSVNQYTRTLRAVPTRNWESNGATVEDPQTTAFRGDTNRAITERDSIGLKLDYKPWDRHLLSASLQASAFSSLSRTQALTMNANRLTDWGENFSLGEAGRGSANQSTTMDEKHGLTRAGLVKYTFTGDVWEIDAAANASTSYNRNRDTDKGFFRTYNTRLEGVSRISFRDIDNGTGAPGTVEVFNAAGSAVDLSQLSNYTLTNVLSQPSDAEDTVTEARFNVLRRFDEMPFLFSLKAGASTRELEREIDYNSRQYTYVGPDGVANTADDRMNTFFDPVMSGTSPGFSFPSVQWGSPWTMYETFAANPAYFTQTVSQQRDTIRNAVIRSPLLNEKVTAGYVLGDAKFFQNRVRLVTGMRYELTESEGWGFKQDQTAIYQLDANGQVVKDASGRPVRRPEAGAPGSVEEFSVMYQKRANYNSRDYDGYYPSAHLTVNLMEDLVLRAAYATTIGRPRIVDIVPNVFVGPNTEFDPGTPGSALGFITAANTTLVPWEAKNYDLRLEYYLPQNGLATVGVFRKDISDFFGNYTAIADEALLDSLGLSHEYVGYTYTTRINVGDARIDGFEASYEQGLGFLGSWAEAISIFTNYTKLKLEGDRQADFTDFIPETANIGLRLGYKRFLAWAKYNYRGKQRREYKDDFPDAAEYIRSWPTVDVSLEYQLSDRFSVFASGRNIFDEPYIWEVSGPVAPAWSALTSNSTYGAQYTLGVKGTF